MQRRSAADEPARSPRNASTVQAGAIAATSSSRPPAAPRRGWRGGRPRRRACAGRHLARTVLSSAVRWQQHPVVVGADAGEAGVAADEELVEEATALAGIAAHEREVLRGEQDRAEDAQHVARLGGRPIDPRPVRPPRGDLHLDRQLPAEVHHLPADDGLLGAPPDQRCVGGDAVRTERGQVARGLDEVGLADAVGPDEDRDPRGEVQLRRLPGPEVGDRQAAQVHELAGQPYGHQQVEVARHRVGRRLLRALGGRRRDRPDERGPVGRGEREPGPLDVQDAHASSR